MEQSKIIDTLEMYQYFPQFENQGINPVGDNAQVTEYLHKQSNKLAPNVINGFSIPSWSLAKVRSDRDG